jgi:lipopolysaccharide exporter
MNPFKANKWIKPGLYTTFDKFSVVILGFINFFILARVLPKSEFGVWVLFISITSIIEILRAGFIKPPFIAFLGNTNGVERSKVASSALFLNAIYSLFISLGILVLGYSLEIFWNAAPLESLLKIYAISNLILVPFSHFENLQQSKLDFRGTTISNFVRSLIPPIYILVSILFSWGVDIYSLAIINLFGNLSATILCIILGWEHRHQVKHPGIKNLKDMLRFARYSFGTNLAALSIRNMDSLMLGRMVSTESVALYNPAIRVANLVEIPTLTVANLIFPKMAQGYKVDDHAYTNQLYERSIGLLLAIMIPISVIMFLFSDFIVLIVAGKNYIEAGDLLKITAFYTLFIPFGRQFGILLDAVRKPEINFYFILGTAFLNIVINYFFILKWGIVGAAYGSLVTYIIRFIFQQIILNSIFGIRTSNIIPSVLDSYFKIFSALKLLIHKK